METIGIIFLVIFGFIFLGIAGWFVKIFEWIFDKLLDGFIESTGCLVIVFIIVLLICSLAR